MGLISENNARIYEAIYASGHEANYPDDMFVRLFHRLFKPYLPQAPHILDYGFGSGATSLHMARQGVHVHGIEISQNAVDKTNQRFQTANLIGDFQVCLTDQLPFSDESFDAVVAWQVLTYNNLDTLKQKIFEFERVLKKGGRFLAAISMPGSALELISVPTNDGLGTRIVQTGAQKGCKICIPNREELETVFEGLNIKVGTVVCDTSEFDLMQNSYWLVSFTRV